MFLFHKAVDEREKSIKVFPSDYAQSSLLSAVKSEPFVDMTCLQQGTRPASYRIYQTMLQPKGVVSDTRTSLFARRSSIAFLKSLTVTLSGFLESSIRPL